MKKSRSNQPILDETDYLLRSPENAKRLLEAIAELENGGGKERQLFEETSTSELESGEK